MAARDRDPRAQDRVRGGTRTLSAPLDVLRARGAAHAPHAHGRSLLDHLAGTAEIARAWGQPQHIVDAALFHSVYGTDIYPHRSIEATARADVRAAIGTEAERLAFLFGSVDRPAFRAAIRNGGARRTIRVADRNGGNALAIEPPEIFALLVIFLANEVDQTCAPDGSPARLFSTIAVLGRDLDCTYGAVPAIVDAIGTFSAADDDETIAAYTHGTDLLNLTERVPFAAEPAIAAARESIGRARYAPVESLLDRAERNLRMLGAPWDKRRSAHAWMETIASLRALAHERSSNSVSAVTGPIVRT